MRTTTIIGIAGASGAGKSLFARQLFERLIKHHSDREISILNEDSYYRQRDDLSFTEREKINYDHPDAMEHGLLVDHLRQLRDGQPVEVPEYDYTTHNRKKETRTLNPSRILIVEGILILHEPELLEQLDLKVFVDVPLDICLIRRLRRDTEQRGRSVESVLSQYESTVRPMFFAYVEPTRKNADVIIPRGGENPGALQVMQHHLERLLS
ncbi:MAG: uridine kinase [Planctomycetota bacterium]